MSKVNKLNKILLVEDDETSNFISKILLEKQGYNDVHEVFNGKDACDFLAKQCPDLIFLDIGMPVMDGWGFLEHKKNMERCPDIKVAMLTSSIRSGDRYKASKYSCVVDYIEKPLSKSKLEAIMAKLKG